MFYLKTAKAKDISGRQHYQQDGEKIILINKMLYENRTLSKSKRTATNS